MAESIEDIQGKLAAYIDGECSSTERAEIVAHLAKNPSHMEMMQELMEQRQLLRRLPREKAPPGLMEDFQGGLERESLLKDTEILGRQSRVGARRWAPILAMAASVALVGGIGAAIYLATPPKDKGTPVAVNKDGAEPKDGRSDGGGAADEMLRRGIVEDVALRTRGGGGKAAGQDGARAADDDHVALVPGRMAMPLPPAPVVNPLPETPTQQQQQAQGVAAAFEDAETVFITVTSGDLREANGQVVRYLDEQRIEYAFAGQDGRPAAATGSRMYALHDSMKAAKPAEGAGAATPDATGNVAAKPAAGGDRSDLAAQTNAFDPGGGGGFGGGGAGRGAGAGRSERFLGGGGRSEPAAGASNTDTRMLAKATPAPVNQAVNEAEGGIERLPGRPDASDVSQQNGMAPDAAAAAADKALSRENRRQVDLSPSLATTFDATPDAVLAGRIIVARNMRREQVTQLASSLSRPERGQWAAVRRARFVSQADAQARGQDQPGQQPLRQLPAEAKSEALEAIDQRLKAAYPTLDRFDTATKEKPAPAVVADGEYWFFNKTTSDALARELGRPGEVVTAADALQDGRVLALQRVEADFAIAPEPAGQEDRPAGGAEAEALASLRCVIILNDSGLPAMQTAQAAPPLPRPVVPPTLLPAKPDVAYQADEPNAAAPTTRPATPTTRPAK